MAITITRILGTDSISGSRIVINDNFEILKDEINSIESFINPDTGTIDGLNSLITRELYVGQVGNYSLELTGIGFDINTNLNVNDGININGLLIHNSFAVINESENPSGSVTIDPLEGYANYSIIQTSTTPFLVELEEGEFGQDITFFGENIGAGVNIIGASGAVLVLDGSKDTIELNDIGSSVTLRFVLDSTGNGAWYIINSHNITLS